MDSVLHIAWRGGANTGSPRIRERRPAPPTMGAPGPKPKTLEFVRFSIHGYQFICYKHKIVAEIYEIYGVYLNFNTVKFLFHLIYFRKRVAVVIPTNLKFKAVTLKISGLFKKCFFISIEK